MIYFQTGSPSHDLTPADLRDGVFKALDTFGPHSNMLIIPPDITRIHSRAGELTRYAYEHNPDAVKAIIPALGTHQPMNSHEIETMFGNLPQNLFREHRWRTDCVQTGTIPADYIEKVSDGTVSYDLPVYFNKILFDQKYDCILSISQVVPHEVAGMAGYTKNIFVGLGGSENIHKTHFLGAAYGMERIMGRAGTPVRQVFNHAVKTFLGDLPIVHIITVLGMASDGSLKVRGLFIGNDDECYNKAAQLSQTVNIHQLDKPLQKVVVHLDPLEFKSTWLGNKSIYRTRMAIADDGELLILAPGVKMFGEDLQIDALIRQFGYRGTPFTMNAINNHDHLKNNLSAAAHLIHGSSEDRFTITYCTGGMDKSTIENVGFQFESVEKMIKRYNPLSLSEGYNTMPDGEEIYYISAPGSGLWACKEKFC
jgi:nickel-dependent lactate racemase